MMGMIHGHWVQLGAPTKEIPKLTAENATPAYENSEAWDTPARRSDEVCDFILSCYLHV